VDLLSHYQNLKGLALSFTIVGEGGEVGHTAKLGTHEAVIREGGDVDSTRRCSFEVLTIDYVDFGSLGHWLLSQWSTIEIKGLRELRAAHFHDVTAYAMFHPTSDEIPVFVLSDLRLKIPYTQLLGYRLSSLASRPQTFSTVSASNPMPTSRRWAELDSPLIELGSHREVDVGLFALVCGWIRLWLNLSSSPSPFFLHKFIL
jgi:hypothetical protein